jgi:hypothetical protein
MMLKGKNLEPNMSVLVDVVYDDFGKINEDCLSKQDCSFTLKDDEYHAKLGPFQFNVCSYKHEGKKFRLVVTVLLGNVKCVTFTSPTFIIKAKKPIVKPGIKGKKRKRDEEVQIPKMERETNFENKYVLLKPKNVEKPNFYPVFEQPIVPSPNSLFDICAMNFNEFFEQEENAMTLWSNEMETNVGVLDSVVEQGGMLESYVDYFN